MIFIKDRHNTVFYQEDDFIGRGKYDTYKGSTPSNFTNSYRNDVNREI